MKAETAHDSPFQRIETFRIWFFAFVCVYAALFLVYPEFSPVDDHSFLVSVGAGKPYPPFIDPGARRFEPLAGQEYNFFALRWFSPYSFQLFNMIELLILVFVLERLLALCEVRPSWRAGVITAFLLTPGMTGVIYRTIVGDRSVAVFLAIFLLAYRRCREGGGGLPFVLALLSANIAMYYKEPVFLLLAVFAAAELYADKENRQLRRLNILLLASAAVYLGVYCYFILPGMSGSSYAESRRFLGYGLNLAQNIRGFSVTSDPFLMLVLPLVAVARLAGKTTETDSFYDSLLFAGLAYVAAMLALNLQFTYYYLVPASLVTLPVLARLLARGGERPDGIRLAALVLFLLALPMKIFWLVPLAALVAVALSPRLIDGELAALLRGAALVIFLLNTVPNGLEVLLTAKVSPVQNRALVESLAGIVARERRPVNIFLYNRERSMFEEAYWSLGRFLEWYGAPPGKFDLRSELPSKGYPTGPGAPWTVFRDPKAVPIREEDLVVTATPAELAALRCPLVWRGKTMPTALPSLDRIIQTAKDRAKRAEGLAPGAPLELLPQEIPAVSRCP